MITPMGAAVCLYHLTSKFLMTVAPRKLGYGSLNREFLAASYGITNSGTLSHWEGWSCPFGIPKSDLSQYRTERSIKIKNQST